jgi:hypothetical protein
MNEQALADGYFRIRPANSIVENDSHNEKSINQVTIPSRKRIINRWNNPNQPVCVSFPVRNVLLAIRKMDNPPYVVSKKGRSKSIVHQNPVVYGDSSTYPQVDIMKGELNKRARDPMDNGSIVQKEGSRSKLKKARMDRKLSFGS